MEKQEIKLRCLEAAVQLAAYTNKEQKVKFVLDAAKEMVEWVGEEVSSGSITPRPTDKEFPRSFPPYTPPNPIPCSPPFEVTCQSQT